MKTLCHYSQERNLYHLYDNTMELHRGSWNMDVLMCTIVWLPFVMLSKVSPCKTHTHAKTFQWGRLGLIQLGLALCFLIIVAFDCACYAKILPQSRLIFISMDGRSPRFSSGSFSTSPFSWHLSVLLNLGFSTLETATKLHVLHVLYVNMPHTHGLCGIIIIW